MSAFDDEFGLFGDETKAEEEERKSTLGARRIASEEAAHDDIEPEDERPRRGRRDRPGGESAGTYAPAAGSGGEPRRREYRERGPRQSADPATAQKRAIDLLGFLAKKLVSKPDTIIVEPVESDKGPLIELVVEHEDLGKVIGRNGRVAQALRTLVRASAEGRISVDIVSFEDDDVAAEPDAEHAPPADAGAGGAADES